MGSILRKSVAICLDPLWSLVPHFKGLHSTRKTEKSHLQCAGNKRKGLLVIFLSIPFCTKGACVVKFMFFLPLITIWNVHQNISLGEMKVKDNVDLFKFSPPFQNIQKCRQDTQIKICKSKTDSQWWHLLVQGLFKHLWSFPKKCQDGFLPKVSSV